MVSLSNQGAKRRSRFRGDRQAGTGLRPVRFWFDRLTMKRKVTEHPCYASSPSTSGRLAIETRVCRVIRLAIRVASPPSWRARM